MTPEHYERVIELFHQVIKCGPEERVAFLNQACGDDAQLRRDVDAMLDADAQASRFLEKPPVDFAAAVLSRATPLIRDAIVSPGSRLGPYEILSHVGSGGMGTVYQARDTRLDRIVAVKLLLPHFADRPDFVRRFEREARAMSDLNHPHICSLHDVGHQSGLSYLVMEYLHGQTLAQRLREGRLTFDEVLRYAIEIASALKEAHNRGVIHYDIKPGNVMLTKWGTKLMDFGLATYCYAPRDQAADGDLRPSLSRSSASKVVLSSLSKILSVFLSPTRPNKIIQSLVASGRIGTLPYMAPEQLLGKETDWRTDMFAFGALLYEMATGRRAFDGSCETGLIRAVLSRDPPPVSSIESLASREFDHIVQTCLAKDREKRWRTPSELLAALTWESLGQRERILRTVAAELNGRPLADANFRGHKGLRRLLSWKTSFLYLFILTIPFLYLLTAYYVFVADRDARPVAAKPVAAKLGITCNDIPHVVTRGSNLTYVVTVRNLGRSTASLVSVSDLLPNDLIDVSVVASQGSCKPLNSFTGGETSESLLAVLAGGHMLSSNTVTCHLGDLKAGAYATLTIMAKPIVAGRLYNLATVTARENERDQNNNSSTTTEVTDPTLPQIPPQMVEVRSK